jgi:hypothetical protein
MLRTSPSGVMRFHWTETPQFSLQKSCLSRCNISQSYAYVRINVHNNQQGQKSTKKLKRLLDLFKHLFLPQLPLSSPFELSTASRGRISPHHVTSDTALYIGVSCVCTLRVAWNVATRRYSSLLVLFFLARLSVCI